MPTATITDRITRTERDGRMLYGYDADDRIICVDTFTTTARGWCLEHDAPADPDRRQDVGRYTAVVCYADNAIPGDCDVVPNVTIPGGWPA